MTSTIDRLSTALDGRYRIERELGAGGMATVYLAYDPKHDRKVALKVLKPELAAVLGAERFVVEIKTTASLQHPHILPLFDSGTADGFLYYVMPFIEGETLRDKLNRETQLAVDEAVRIACAVADALDYAHRHGVIHRDIKPENILLHDGRPIVADFGIALAVSAAAGGRMTETGLSLGTPHYMSPEQATADKEITGRADIYSLASVLYEMLTGNPPHLGASAQQIIMKIIAEPVEAVTKYRKSVPPHVAEALTRALEKLPADRFPTAREFADALQNPTFAIPRSTLASQTAGRSMGHRASLVPLLGTAVGVLALLAIWGWIRPQPAHKAGVVRYLDGLMADSLLLTLGRDFALSPDGSRIAFVVGAASTRGRLLVRRRDQLLTTEIPGSAGASNPFFSPDGAHIAYFAWQSPAIHSLRVADLDGGPSRTIVQSTNAMAALWEADGYIYYQNSAAPGLSRVRESGGTLTPFTVPDTAAGELQHRLPATMHDGKRILFIVTRRGGQPQVAIADLSSGKHRYVGLTASAAWYTTCGHIVYPEAGSLRAVRFDSRRGTVDGEPSVVVQDVAGTADIQISDNGTLMYIGSEGAGGGDQLFWVNRDGSEIRAAPWLADFADLAVSPDGKQIVVGIRQKGVVEQWVRDVATGSMTRLTFEADGSFEEPQWAPDGASVGFIKVESDRKNSVFRRRADGSTQAERLFTWDGGASALAWHPDGKQLVIREGSGNNDLYLFRIGTDSVPQLLLSSRFSENDPAISPDGRWLAYTSNETGESAVYVRPFQNPEASRVKVSTGVGNKPKWSRTGRELYFVGNTAPTDTTPFSSSIMVAQVQAGPAFIPGAPQVVFTRNETITYWGMTPDAARFVIITSRPRPNRRPAVTIVDNWFSELNRR